MKDQVIVRPSKLPNAFLFAFFIIMLITISQMTALRTAAAATREQTPAAGLAGAPALSWPLIENVGQFDASARFLLRRGDQFIWLANDGLWLTALDSQAVEQALAVWRLQEVSDSPIRGVHIKLSFTGAAAPVLEPYDRHPATISYLIGSDTSQWRAAVPAWGGVRYRNLYPGVDLVVGQGSPWHLQSQSMASLDSVNFLIEGADDVSMGRDGLHLATAAGDLTLPLQVTDELAPAIRIQQADAQRFLLTLPTGSAEQLDHLAPAAASDAADLVYSSYLGGSNWELGAGIAVDEAGMVYTAGSTPSADFPTTPGAFDTSISSIDAYVAKFDPAGNGSNDLLYATFLGGSDIAFDFAGDLAVANGEAFVSGSTASTSFPTTSGAFDRSCGSDGACDGLDDAFFARLSSNGSSLLYGTYFGGDDEENASGIAVAGGQVYLGGYTKSADFPTTANAFDRNCGTDGMCNFSAGAPLADAFFVKLAPGGNGTNDLLYGTYLGGSSRDQANGITVAGGDAYVTGWSDSFNFPATGYGGGRDAFVVRLDPAGGGSIDRVYGRFLGGTGTDIGNGVTTISDQAFVTGETRSTNFPVTDGGTFNGGDSDAFISQLNGSGTVLHSAYLGGNGSDVGYDVAAEASGALVLAGYTESTNFPVTNNAYDAALNGESDVFVARGDLDNTLPKHISYATYLGGSGTANADVGSAVVVDQLGHAYLTGSTESADFPTTAGAFDTTLAGSRDSFVAKLRVVGLARHDIELGTKWFMISSYLEPQDTALDVVLQDIVDDVTLVKNGQGEVFWPALDIDDIGDWNLQDGYQIHMKKGATLTIYGRQVSPETTPLDLPVSWSLIAYLRQESMPIQTALASISDSLHLVKNDTGEVYWPDFGVNQIGDMQPGQGYMLHMAVPGTLIYPAN